MTLINDPIVTPTQSDSDLTNVTCIPQPPESDMIDVDVLEHDHDHEHARDQDPSGICTRMAHMGMNSTDDGGPGEWC